MRESCCKVRQLHILCVEQIEDYRTQPARKAKQARREGDRVFTTILEFKADQDI